MAIAKTPKTKIEAAKPAAAKPAAAKPAAAQPVIAKTVAAKPAAPKPVAAARPAAAAKAPEEAVIHSAEVAAETIADTAAKAVPAVSEIVEAKEPAAKAAVVPAAKAAVAVVPAAKAAVAVVPAAKAAVAVVNQAKHAGDEMLSKGVGPLLDFGRENAILLVAAGNEFALGLHKLSLSLLDWSAESCDKSVAAGQAMLSAKTVEEVVDLSRSLAQDGFQQILKESSELSALSAKLLEDTLVPLPGRFAAAVEKLASHAA